MLKADVRRKPDGVIVCKYHPAYTPRSPYQVLKLPNLALARSRRRESSEQAERGPQSWHDFMAIQTPNREEHRIGSLTTSATCGDVAEDVSLRGQPNEVRNLGSISSQFGHRIARSIESEVSRLPRPAVP